MHVVLSRCVCGEGERGGGGGGGRDSADPPRDPLLTL